MYIIYENIFEIFKYIIYWMKKKKKKSNFTFIEKHICIKSKRKKAKEFGIDIMRVEDGIERLKRSKTINGCDAIYIIK